MKTSTLSLHSISKIFKQEKASLAVLNSINETFYQNKSYAITGASGVGKSTLLHIIAGIEQPTSGTVCFNNANLAFMPTNVKEQFFNQNIGLIFQLPYLINELTVLENVMLKGIIGKMPHEECKEEAYRLLKQLGLEAKANSFPQTLSGGQQQRVAIGRALLNKPTFLLADEPTGNLDEKTGYELVDLLVSYQQEHGMGLIISSHDSYIMQKMAIKLVLKDGFLIHDVKEPTNVQGNSIYL